MQERSNIPNNEFDKEYATMWKREMLFLREKGIRYTFVKKTQNFRIPVYKYEKTPELFEALQEFYTIVKNEAVVRLDPEDDTI